MQVRDVKKGPFKTLVRFLDCMQFYVVFSSFELSVFKFLISALWRRFYASLS